MQVDPDLRTLLVRGVRAGIQHVASRDDWLSRWLNALVARKHTNVDTGALANMTARMAWAIVHGGIDYDPALAPADSAA